VRTNWRRPTPRFSLENAKGPTGFGGAFRVVNCGDVLLSHTVSRAVPSALKGLTSGFGMGPGVSPSQKSPQSLCFVINGCRLFSGNRTGTRTSLLFAQSCCEQVARPISTGQLHTLRCFHFRPINPVFCWGPYPPYGGGSPHLEAGFPLRCFQRLSFPNVANQPCPWQDNWHTRGSSIPVLSY
jgi:hypothetical protein